MKAAVLVTTALGKLYDVNNAISKLGVKDSLSVTGCADIVIFLEGSMKEIFNQIKNLFEIEGVETTETLWEVS
jgi:hypothetical protein